MKNNESIVNVKNGEVQEVVEYGKINILPLSMEIRIKKIFAILLNKLLVLRKLLAKFIEFI